MLVFPNCKINLGLHILRKRADGFHDLETIFYPLPLKDALEVVHSNADFSFTTTGNSLDVDPENNVCVKAYQLVKKDFPLLPAVKLHLHKTIPSGAGLGGGSADAAFTLLLLNRKFALGLSESQLIEYAAQLGSDCPFFIKNKPCYASGRGEVLEEVPLDLSAYKLVLVNPGLHVPTGWAFSQLTPRDRPSLRAVVDLPIADWRDLLINDFEQPIFTHFPEIGSIKKRLYETGALYTSMSGSGSSVFGLFEKSVQPALAFPSHYFQKELSL